MVVVIVISACQTEKIEYYDLTPEKLVDNGFYVYLLPESTVQMRGWKQTIRMKAFDKHCTQSDTIPQVNPVLVSYQDGTEYSPLAIEITPRYQAWNTNAAIQILQVEVPFEKEGKAEYYVTDSGGFKLKFEDAFGIEVIVSSWENKMDISELSELISQLEYIGPDVDVVGNPWNKACE